MEKYWILENKKHVVARNLLGKKKISISISFYLYFYFKNHLNLREYPQ